MPPVLDLLLCLALFTGLVFGLGLPLVATAPLRADEKLCAAAAVSLILIYLAAFVIYWTHLPPAAFYVLPAAAGLLLIVRRHACLAVLGAPAARDLFAGWLIVAGWVLGFLCLVRSYSGGAWTGDWVEHYQRSFFFLKHWPLNTQFISEYSLPARPPLANLVNGAFLALTEINFAHHQIFSTLAGSLALMPALLLTGEMAPSHRSSAQTLVMILFMLNPSFMENATFAWTKLPTVFFVLAGLYFVTQGMNGTRRLPLIGGFVCLAAGLLAHYSAGPYLLILVVAYFWWRRFDLGSSEFWRNTAWCAALGGLLLATWFGWSLKIYGLHGSFLSNSSVTGSHGQSLADWLAMVAGNIFTTIIPHPFRHVDYAFFAQPSRLGFLRDYAFMIYQVNLPFALGSLGGLFCCWLLWRRWRSVDSGQVLSRSFWLFFVAGCFVIGVAVNGKYDTWGLAHICLQPLIALGLAFIAANFHRLAPFWRRMLAAGITLDFLLGVLLQFFLENRSYSFLRLFLRLQPSWTLPYSQFAEYNLYDKDTRGLVFVGDWPIARPLIIAVLLCLFCLAFTRLRRMNAAEDAP